MLQEHHHNFDNFGILHSKGSKLKLKYQNSFHCEKKNNKNSFIIDKNCKFSKKNFDNKKLIDFSKSYQQDDITLDLKCSDLLISLKYQLVMSFML